MRACLSVALIIGAIALHGCSAEDPGEPNTAAPSENISTSINAPPSNKAARQGRVIPVNAQGVAEVGLTVRIKSVELGADATILDISASYGGTASSDVDLAFSDTFIRDDQGNKLMLKRITGNQDLTIREGEQMDGRLVFLGAVPPSASSITLVLNDGNFGTDITGPGLNIPIDLQNGAQ